MSVPVYREHAPPPGLAAAVECLWTVRSHGEPSPPALNRILPDGCMDLVFDLGGGSPTAPRGFAVGAMTRALATEVAGRVEIAGVRFRPGGAARLLGLPAGELTDRRVALDDLMGGSAYARVLEVPSADAAVREIAAVLTAARPCIAAPEPVAAAAWARLEATAGALPVRALAAELGVGERRLQRTFHDHVGLTPKEAARVARLRAVLAVLRAEPALALGRAALRAGYYDQPHFNREFARLVGVAPDAWRAERVGSVQAAPVSAR